MPHSRRSAATGTPVHSLQLVKPCTRCTSESVDPPRHSLPLLPEHSRKVDPRDRRHPSQLVYGEDERAIDQTMNRQRMRRRIDDRHARVMPLEVERRGRDDPVGVVQRRPARRFFERDLGVLIEKAGGLFVGRSRSVGADGRAERAGLGAAARLFSDDRRRGPRSKRRPAQEIAAGNGCACATL